MSLTFEGGPGQTTGPAIFKIGQTIAASSSGVAVAENGTAPESITVTIPRGSDTAKFARLMETILP